jgi:hypothetical protein
MLSSVENIQSSLSKRAAAGWDTVSIASLIVSVWRDTDAALAPIIGHRGVGALFRRTLHLIRHDYPWLTASHESMADPIDFTAFHSTLSQRTSANIVAANGALLQKFLEQLVHLIGESLTERLLRSVVDTHSTGASPQEPTR